MSVDRALEGWEGVQRQGQDIADRFSSLAQGLGCMLQSHLKASGIPLHSPSSQTPAPSSPDSVLDRPCCDQPSSGWPWPWIVKPRRSRLNRVQFKGRRRACNYVEDGAPDDRFSLGQGAAGIHELGQRLSQAGADLGACVGGFVWHVVNQFSWPFHTEAEPQAAPQPAQSRSLVTLEFQGDYVEWKEVDEAGTSENKGRVAVGEAWNRFVNGRHRRAEEEARSSQEASEMQDVSNDELFAFLAKPHGQLHKQQGSVSVTTTFDSRTQDVESSVVARGDLWRAEASHGGNTSANGPSPLFLLQIGPILFVRDTTLLLPVHLSKQHLLWYGFDRKNGLHSLCPAVWSKHRRWLLMSMICLNPLTCSFMDLQFPNGQFTYVAGEGLTSSAFCPAFGGLLQAQSRQPGDTKISFSKKICWGTRITPAIQLPEKSFSLGIVQALAWQRSGVLVRPTIQLSVTPTFGGRNAGWRAEFIHSPKEKLSWACGCALTIQPTAFASISLGRSKRSGSNSGSSGLMLQVDVPTENINRASFSIQLNSGVEF